MRNDAFYDNIKYELQFQSDLYGKCKDYLNDAIEGSLYIRKNQKSTTYYQVISGEDGRKRVNITDKPDIIKQLLQKEKYKNMQRICRENIKLLKSMLKKYQPFLPSAAIDEEHRKLLIDFYLNGPPALYRKALFDPEKHIHETVCGELVRSKSEVIIANALWHFKIPFNYEELFPHPDEDGNWFYPDFTIHCPDGTTIIWEHWGLLDRHTYCVHNAGKLNTYNANGYVIGKNLIITQDDNRGNCTTALVYHIIENYVLPHFK